MRRRDFTLLLRWRDVIETEWPKVAANCCRPKTHRKRDVIDAGTVRRPRLTSERESKWIRQTWLSSSSF